MNHSGVLSWRIVWLLFAFCIFGSFVRAEPTLGAEQQEKDLGVLTAKVDQCRSGLKNTEEGIKRLAALDHDLAIMKTCVERTTELAGELKALDGRLRDLRMLELEPKQREVEQIRQTTETKVSQLRYERQSLETEIVQHNNKPRIFSEMQSIERANYIAETEALKARWQRLMEAAALLQSEMQPRFEMASRAMAKAQQDFNDAAARREKILQLSQEQIFQYANTRTFLVEQLTMIEPKAASGSGAAR